MAGRWRADRGKDRMRMSSHQRVSIHVIYAVTLSDHPVFVNYQPPPSGRFAANDAAAWQITAAPRVVPIRCRSPHVFDGFFRGAGTGRFMAARGCASLSNSGRGSRTILPFSCCFSESLSSVVSKCSCADTGRWAIALDIDSDTGAITAKPINAFADRKPS